MCIRDRYAAFFNQPKTKSGGKKSFRKKPGAKKPKSYPNRATSRQGKKPPVTSIVFAPEGKSVASVSQAGLSVHTWPDLKSQRTVKLKTTNPHSIVFSPDGKHVAVGGGVPSEDGTIEVFSWPEAKPIAQLGEHADSVMSVAWQDDDTIVSASLDKEVRVWSVKSGKLVRTFKGHSRGVTSVSFLADKKTMITAGIDQSIRVWNAETGELIRSMAMHTKPIHDVAVRPATEGLPMIASASDDRTVRLWQPTIGRMVRFAKLPVRPLNVEWLPDGSRVIAACTDGKAYTINPDTVQVTNVAPAISGWAWAMQVHPNQNALAVGGPNGTIKVLTLPQISREQSDE